MFKVHHSVACCVVAVALAGCTTVDVVKTPPLSFAGTVLSKGIEKNETSATPTERNSVFSTDDRNVVATVTLENLSGKHDIRWEWYTPTGALFAHSTEFPLTVPEKKYQKTVTLWHKLPIEDRAQNYPGEWQVQVYLDGEVKDTKHFRIVAPKAPELDDAPPSAASPDPEKWALVIGIEKFSNLPAADFAVKDSQAIAKYLNRLAGVPEDNIIVLNDSKATRLQIEGYLRDYLPKKLTKDSTLYVYFAGHGMPDIEKREAYLVPYDADAGSITQTGYRLKNFYEDINNLNIKKAYVFLDSCFNGATRNGSSLLAGAKPPLITVDDKANVSQKIVSLTASSSGEISNAYTDRKHGLFTYYLLMGMRGAADVDKDRTVTMAELYNYVKPNVARAARLQKSLAQTPSLMPELGAMGNERYAVISTLVK